MQKFIQTKYNLSSELLATLLSCAYLAVMFFFIQSLSGSILPVVESGQLLEWSRVISDSMMSAGETSCEQHQCHSQGWLILVVGLIASHFYWALAFKD